MVEFGSSEASTFRGSWAPCGKYGWICTGCDYPGMQYHHAFPKDKKTNLVIAPMDMVGTILNFETYSHEFAVIGIEGEYNMDVIWLIFQDQLLKKRDENPVRTKS